MSDDLGPPDKERPGARNSDRVNPKVGSSPKSPTTAKVTPPRGRCWDADSWRYGFGSGFRDALRLAAREIDDPAAREVLDRLADQYYLAG
jgi:hypothetical protein